MFLGAPEAFGVSFYEKITAHLTMSSHFPKNIDALLLKAQMRTNEDAGRRSLQQEFRVKVFKILRVFKDSNIA